MDKRFQKELQRNKIFFPKEIKVKWKKTEGSYADNHYLRGVAGEKDLLMALENNYRGGWKQFVMTEHHKKGRIKLRIRPLKASVAPGAQFLSGWNFRASFR